MPVQLLRSRVQHPVEFEHGYRVLQLEAASEDGELLPGLELGFFGCRGELTDLGFALHLLRDRVEPAEYTWVVAIVSEVFCTFDHVISETRPTCFRIVMASSITNSAPTIFANSASS